MVKKWKGLSSEQAIKYVDDKLDGTWHNFDTNGADFIDVRDAFFWMRQIVDDDVHHPWIKKIVMEFKYLRS